MSRAVAAVLLVLALVGQVAPAVARADAISPACPVEDLPATPVTHAAAVACLQSWGILTGPLDADVAITRGTAGRLVADLVVAAGMPLRTPDANVFSDDDGHPDEVSLAELHAVGVLVGSPDGRVGPDRLLTRGQLATVATRTVERLTGAPLPTGDAPFADVVGTVHAAAIAQAYAAGLVVGRTPTLFAPARPATQGQYATLATRILGLLVQQGVVDPPWAPSAPFALAVTPTSVADAAGGQLLVLLVSLARDDVPADGPVTVTVAADAATIPEEAALLTPGAVGELSVVLHDLDGTDVAAHATELRTPVVISAVRDGVRHRVVVPVRVTPGTDDRREPALEHLSRWTAWLAEAHPELGIDAGTTWTPTTVQPHILVVMHYLFFSQDWELGLTWHVMIPPYDWSRIYLRRRGELQPTLAFELPSVSDPAGVPVAIDPPAQVDR